MAISQSCRGQPGSVGGSAAAALCHIGAQISFAGTIRNFASAPSAQLIHVVGCFVLCTASLVLPLLPRFACCILLQLWHLCSRSGGSLRLPFHGNCCLLVILFFYVGSHDFTKIRFGTSKGSAPQGGAGQTHPSTHPSGPPHPTPPLLKGSLGLGLRHRLRFGGGHRTPRFHNLQMIIRTLMLCPGHCQGGFEGHGFFLSCPCQTLLTLVLRSVPPLAALG